jgi:hypothetical protein
MICNNCGYVNPDNNKYCANCGKRFTRIQSELTDMNPEIQEIKEELAGNNRYHKDTTSNKRNIPTSYKLLACGLIIIILLLVGFAIPGNNDTTPLINDTPNNTNTTGLNDTDNTTKAIQSVINVTVNNNLKAGDTVNISGYLSDDSNKKLIDCEIIVNIDGNEYKTRTDTNGYYQQTINQITAGTHKITVLYAGDENIKGSQNSTTLNVEYKKSNITLELEDQLNQSNKIILKCMLTDDENKPITNAQVKINTLNHEQTINTDNNGQYQVEITNLEHKTQNITAKYEGDNNHEGSQATVQLKVEKEKTIMNAKIDDSTDEKIKVTGNLKNDKNQPLNNVAINLNSGNQELKTNTNETGDFSLETNDVNTTQIILSYEGNDTTDSAQKILQVEKVKIKTSITVKSNDTPQEGDNVTINGILKDEKNHPLENATIKISDGRHEYTTNTDDNGEYNYTISNITEKNSDITVTYEGNNTYSECHDKIVILIDTDNVNSTTNQSDIHTNTSNYH